MAKTDLRCERHMHGQLEDSVLFVQCRQCSKDAGETVCHRWNAMTGERLDDDDPDEPTAIHVRCKEYQQAA